MQHAILAVLAELLERHRIRRDTRHLMSLPDTLLRDMGITCDDVPHVTGALALQHRPFFYGLSKGHRWRSSRDSGSMG